MPKQVPLSPRQVSQLIHAYLQEHPKLGVRGLAEKAGLSYDSVQKYAKGQSSPPPKKWELLRAVIDSIGNNPVSTKVSLFEQPPIGSRAMKSEQPNGTERRETARNGLIPEVGQSGGNNKRVASDEYGSREVTDTFPEASIDFLIEPTYWSQSENRQETFLPVHGFVWFYPEEMEIIDHPSFQRLAGMHQLGMTNLVYRGRPIVEWSMPSGRWASPSAC